MALLFYILRLTAKILSLVLFVLTIAGAYGGMVNPYIWATPSVLSLVFPYFLGATVIVGVLWLVARRWTMAVVAGLTVLACWPSVSLVYPMHGAQEAKPGEKTFTLLTFNIIHAQDVRQPDYAGNRGLEYLLEADADIVCLQEMETLESPEIQVFPDSLRASLHARYPYRIFNGPSDVGVLSKFPVKRIKTGLNSEETLLDYEVYSLDVKGERLYIVNVHMTSYHLTEPERGVVTDINSYASAKKSVREFKGSILAKLKESFRKRADNAGEIRRVVEQLNGPVIICGDFNDVPGSWAYRTLCKDGMKDAYLATNFGPIITYNLHHFYFHIDQVLYKGDIRPLYVQKNGIDCSDHNPLETQFAFTNPDNNTSTI